MVKALIYDYDGVISNSVNVKTEAFAELYRPYGKEIEEKVINYHLANGGISRFEKFKHFHGKFLGIEISQNEVTKLAEKFSDLVLIKVIESEYIPGAYEFIKKNSKGYLQFICTGTPETEIKTILKEKSIEHFFNNIYGSPVSKELIISKILADYNLKSGEVVFFGDATTDLNAASFHKVRFVGINSSQFEATVEQYPNFDEIKLDFLK